MLNRKTNYSGARSSCLAITAAASLTVLPLSALAEDGSRYSMAPADGGSVIRLDRQTGEMSICSSQAGSWSCRPMPDTLSKMKRKIDALRDENENLRGRRSAPRGDSFASRGDTIPPDAPSEGEPPPPPGNLPIPTEREVDMLFDYVEGMVRKFKERIDRLKKEAQKEPPTSL